MIKRKSEKVVKVTANEFPVVSITGPRQSGKTTLVRKVFKNKPYVNLENLDQYRFAKEDPRGFLAQFRDGAILDEVQRCPDLFNYLQGVVDKDGRNGLYVLTRSSQFQLNKSISQSLAGRVGGITLLPFSISEMKSGTIFSGLVNDNIFNGFYPRIVAQDSDPRRWLNAYIETYVEKDIRQLLDIKNRDSFLQFVSLCAANIGSLLNLSRIATDCSISVPTAKSWLSVLHASYICFTLQPHYANFRKRLVKTPKLYFYDVGLASRLLGIQNKEQISLHPLRGNLFENLIISDIIKTRLHNDIDTKMFFWRDKTGLEIDLIFETISELIPLEIKSGATINSSWFENLKKWQNLAGNQNKQLNLCYAGDWHGTRSEVNIYTWDRVGEAFGSIQD